jgi:hypothetical protein
MTTKDDLALITKLNSTPDELTSLKELLELTTQAAYGFTPIQAQQMFTMMFDTEPILFTNILACAATMGQIKGNVEDNKLMDDTSEMLDLHTTDKTKRGEVMNYSAMRMIGALICAIWEKEIKVFADLNKKAGNPWLGPAFPDTTAGKITKELYESFTKEEWAIAEVPEAKKKLIGEALKSFYTNTNKGLSSTKNLEVGKRIGARRQQILLSKAPPSLAPPTIEESTPVTKPVTTSETKSVLKV